MGDIQEPHTEGCKFKILVGHILWGQKSTPAVLKGGRQEVCYLQRMTLAFGKTPTQVRITNLCDITEIHMTFPSHFLA